MEVKRLVITIEGKDERDLELALEEVSRSVAEGNLCGHNSNDSGAYHFDISEGRRALAW